jgi:hypothetical protein
VHLHVVVFSGEHRRIAAFNASVAAGVLPSAYVEDASAAALIMASHNRAIHLLSKVPMQLLLDLTASHLLNRRVPYAYGSKYFELAMQVGGAVLCCLSRTR